MNGAKENLTSRVMSLIKKAISCSVLEVEGELKIPHDIAVDQSGTCMSQSLRIRGCRNLN